MWVTMQGLPGGLPSPAFSSPQSRAAVEAGFRPETSQELAKHTYSKAVHSCDPARLAPVPWHSLRKTATSVTAQVICTVSFGEHEEARLRRYRNTVSSMPGMLRVPGFSGH